MCLTLKKMLYYVINLWFVIKYIATVIILHFSDGGLTNNKGQEKKLAVSMKY